MESPTSNKLTFIRKIQDFECVFRSKIYALFTKVAVWSSMKSDSRVRFARSGRKHIRPKSMAFQNFEADTGLLATDAVYETEKISNPRIVPLNGREVAMVDVEWSSTQECLNCLSGSREFIRENMDPADQAQFDEIMQNEQIRSSFESTRNDGGE